MLSFEYINYMVFLDVVLPFLFFELWYIIIAFVFVVLIETFIVRLFLRNSFFKLFKILLKANFQTTIIGYFLQGVVRIIILFIAASLNFKLTGNDIFNALVENVGIGFQNRTSVLITICTSMIIALGISIVVERKVLIKSLNNEAINKITTSIILANIVSYCLLFVWIYFNYLRSVERFS